MPLTSEIADYDPAWPGKFEREAQRLQRIFGEGGRAHGVVIHHIGSTAVPGLKAKPEIDMLIVVDGFARVDAWASQLAGYGYRRGGDLSPGHLFFKRNVDGVRTHKIHVCLSGHDQIDRMLTFRDHLRSDSGAREQYQALKLRLEAQNTTGIGEYLAGKAPFIERVLAAAEANPRST